MDLKERRVLPATHALPAQLQQLARRMRQSIPVLHAFHPTEANAIAYHKSQGHVLRAHVDDRQLSTGEIVTLSLLVSILRAGVPGYAIKQKSVATVRAAAQDQLHCPATLLHQTFFAP